MQINMSWSQYKTKEQTKLNNDRPSHFSSLYKMNSEINFHIHIAKSYKVIELSGFVGHSIL